ncbi:MAG: 6-bladed beta-propeller, partial [Clostridium sp.]|nr:6-bladed beta-propeller [Clostridium sp.]
TGNIKQTPLYVFLVFLTVYSCRSTNTIEIGPLAGSSIGDSTLMLPIEDQYPCMQLVTEGAINLEIPEEPEYRDSLINTKRRYLPLETTEECLIGRIDKLETDGTDIFVFDETNNRALRFSQVDGRFLNKFGCKGRGPGEYTSLTDMAINRKNKEISLLDYQGRKLLHFNYEGKLLRETPLYYLYNKMEYTGEHVVLQTAYNGNPHTPAISFNYLTMAQPDQTPLFVGFPYAKYLDEYFRLTNQHAFVTRDDEVFYNHVLSDTIWQIKDNGVCEAKFIYKFAGRDNLFDEKDFQQITHDEYTQKQENVIHSLGEYTLTKDFLYTEISGGIRLLYCIPTGHYIIGKPYFKHFAERSYNRPLFIFNKTSFVNILQPFDLIKRNQQVKNMYNKEGYELYCKNQLTEEERQLLSTMTEEDNPILEIIDIESF